MRRLPEAPCAGQCHRRRCESGARVCLPALLVGLGLAAGAAGDGHAPSWSRDVRPILEAHCTRCHRPAGSAPEDVDLSVYGTDARPGAARWARAIAESVRAGTMPPWLPDPRFDDLLVAPRLTAEEIRVLTDWARAGAPAGDEGAATSEVVVPPSADFTLAPPDLALETTATVKCEPLAGEWGERHWLDLHLQHSRWITGLEILPADSRSVRRIVVHLESPESARQVRLVESETEEMLPRLATGQRFLGQWLPGDRPLLFPDTAGLFAPAGSRVVIDVLLRRGVGAPCSTPGPRLGLLLDRPRQEIDLWLEARELVAEPRRRGRRRGVDAELEGRLELDEDVDLLALHPQVSEDVSSYELALEYADRRRRTVLLVPDYRPALGASYALVEPLPLPAGTTVVIRGRVARAAGAPPPRLGVVLQYVLAHHLIAKAPDLPPQLLVELGYGKAAVDSLGAPAPPEDRSRAFVPPEPQLFRADNGYHLVEGSIAAAGVFRLRIADSGGRILDPRNFAGQLVFEYRDELSGTYAESRLRLRPLEDSLWARVPEELPVSFFALLWLAGVENRVDFDFAEARGGPAARRVEPVPVDLPPRVAIGPGGRDARLHLLEALRRQQSELEAAAGGRRGDVATAAYQLWQTALAACRAMSDLGAEERAHHRLVGSELARAALAVHRLAKETEEESYRMQSALERLSRAIAAAAETLDGL